MDHYKEKLDKKLIFIDDDLFFRFVPTHSRMGNR